MYSNFSLPKLYGFVFNMITGFFVEREGEKGKHAFAETSQQALALVQVSNDGS